MLETKIEALTQAVIALTEVILKIEARENQPVAAPVAAPVIVEAPKEVVKEIIEAIDKTVMPAAPTFESVVEAAPAGNAAPFTDGKGLIAYVMDVYKELGPEKGAKIQGVLTEMGLQNVNELRPTEYDAFYSKVEALK